jgi:PAS domain S-box-containing protein
MGQFRRTLPGDRGPWFREAPLTNPNFNDHTAPARIRHPDATAFETSGLMHDTTVREVAEALSLVVDTAAVGMVALDGLGFVRSLNPAASRMFGYVLDEVIGRHVAMLLPKLCRSSQRGDSQSCRDTGLAQFIGTSCQVEGRRKDGTTFSVDLDVKELRVDDADIFIGVLRDTTVRTRADERQRLMIAELNHRMRNTLAKMGMIIELSRSSAASVDAFADALSGRINALARTYAHCSGSGRTGFPLRELIEGEIAPYRSGTNMYAEGPDLGLNPEPAQTLALVFHELATNAVKYGALSIADGRVAVRWQVAGEVGAVELKLVWEEAGGPTVVAPTRQGFGTRLIQNLLHHELGGRVELSLAPTGLRCEMEVPLARVSGNQI